MALTTRKKIIDLLVKRLEGVVDDFICYSTESVAIAGRQEMCAVTGEYGGDSAPFPREFILTVESGSSVRIQEVTLKREYHDGLPFPLVDRVIPAGPVVEITPGIGIFVCISTSAAISDSWRILLGKCASTIRSVRPYYFAPDDCPSPSIVIWPAEESRSSKQYAGMSDNEISFAIDLRVDSSSRDSSLIEDLIGDVCDEISRDPANFDNTSCLSHDCEIVDVSIYNSESLPAEIGAIITAKVKYRTAFNNTRIRR